MYGILRHFNHVLSPGYIYTAVATNRDRCPLTMVMVGTISWYLRLYIYLMVDIYKVFVGWFRGRVVLKKRGNFRDFLGVQFG